MDIFFIKKSFLEENEKLVSLFYKNEFKSEKRKQEYALSRYLLYYVSKHYKIKNPETEIKNNKPHFVYSDIQFSISHSKGIVAIAFDKNPIGFDIQFMREVDYEKMGNYFKKGFSSFEEFYEFWTRHEAEFKLQSKANYGLTFKLSDDYMISIAGAEDFLPVNIYELENNLCLKKLEQSF